MNKKRLTAYLLLLLTAALWGFASPVVKYTLSFIDPLGFLFYRFWLVSLLFLVPFLIAIIKKPIPLLQLIKLLLIGVLGGPITLLLIFYGADKTSAIDSSLIVAMAPILIVISGAIFLKEKITRRENLGLVIALAGTMVTIVQPLIEGSAFAQGHLWGNLIVFSSNIAWTAYVILIKKESKKYSPLILTALTFFSGLIILTPFFLNQRFYLINLQKSAFLPQTALFEIQPKAIFGILYMTIFSSIIAYTTYNWGISLIEASEATIFTYLQPVFAAPLAFFWLGEKISFPFLVGAALVALGVFLTESRGK